MFSKRARCTTFISHRHGPVSSAYKPNNLLDFGSPSGILLSYNGLISKYIQGSICSGMLTKNCNCLVFLQEIGAAFVHLMLLYFKFYGCTAQGPQCTLLPELYSLRAAGLSPSTVLAPRRESYRCGYHEAHGNAVNSSR